MEKEILKPYLSQKNMNLLNLAEIELLGSNTDRKHPFRLAELITFGPEYPEARTVVKRAMTQDWKFLFYTDLRTPKVKEIQKNSKTSLHFYHPEKQLQIRIKGEARVLKEGDLFDIHLHKAKTAPTVSDYTAIQPPSTVLENGEKPVYGEKLFFALIQFRALELDILKLEQGGHQRAYFKRKGATWCGEKLVP